MIEEAIHIPSGTRMQTQVCIIGGGAAGITLALELGRAGVSLIVLAGGGRKETDFGKNLHEASSLVPGNHEPMSLNRRRMWGGATSAWGGRCVPYDRIDFEKRDWVPDSGWPISYEEAARHYARALELSEAGANSFDAHESFPGLPAEIIEGLDNEDIVSWPLNRWGPPTHFAKRYEKELAAMPNVRVLLDAHAVHLHCNPAGDAISHIAAAHSKDPKTTGSFTVHATHFVLACGALENARLLLQGNERHPDGIGNTYDNVGRYYMSHIGGLQCILRVTNDAAKISSRFLQDAEGVYCRKRFWITPEAQRSHRIGNIIMELYEPTEDSRKKHSPFFSSILLGRMLSQALRQRAPGRIFACLREHKHTLAHHFLNSAGNLRQWLPEAASTVRRELFNARHCPGFIINADSRSFILSYQGEHAPNRASRVFLASDTDAFGLRRLVGDPHFTTQDQETALTAHRLMAAALQNRGIGQLDYDEALLRADITRRYGNFDSMAHQLGTTRMGDNPKTSVADPNAAVWNMDNLFIAGASIFPTSSHANPTLTLIALALRLAEHLKKQVIT